MASSPQYIGTVKTPAASFANADGTAFKTILAAGTSGSRIDTLSAANTDTANAYVLQLSVQVSGVDYILGEVTIPIGSGTNGTAKSVAALNPVDIPSLAYTENGSLYLASGAVLRGKVKTTVAGSNTVQVTGVAGDY
jgi:hypothetical protein